ncbi:uncharacterized protein LOC121947054 [Plectropomus leopardus]|uniref:uncharacterized protein LOC121947054 n=1 Tax=Plectropomus leopardus TaxID=160734 RepID=UPI001C4C76E1|nr:uncharacterized protein LOC121947054 [Plectropomus leopardus]XP_042347870.1 uncharacterized protein LOC121947054 [Plectropomus leopardus]
MSQKVLFIKLLLLHYTTQSESEIEADCHENVSVMCPGFEIDTVNFISLAWYKFNNTMKHGIIRKGRDNIIQDYGFPRSPKPQFGKKHSLLLTSVTPEDSGTYECDISANVGGRNLNLHVNLKVNDCATQTELTTTTSASNTTLHCKGYGEDFPVKWGIVGYVAVGLTKIVLSLVTIGVIQAVHMRSSRRWQRKW